MFKSRFMSILSAGVLAAGLVSCSKEKKVIEDVYQAPAPEIVQGSGRMDFQQWDARRQRTLSLTDTLDFSNSRPTDLTVSSKCKLGSEFIPFSKRFHAPESIPLFQILPEEVLGHDLKDGVECSFEFRLFNRAGSQHIFSLAALNVSESSEKPPVWIGRDSQPDEPGRLRVFAQNLNELKLRYQNTQAAAVTILCGDFHVATLPFEQVLGVDHFDFRVPLLWPSIKSTEPAEICRAVVFERGEIAALSPLFEVVMPHKSFQISINQAYADWTMLTPNILNDLNAYNGQSQPLTLATFEIQNQESVPRYIQIDDTSAAASLDLWFSQDTNTTWDSLPGASVNLVVSGGKSHGGTPPAVQYEIPPKGTLQLRVMLPARIACRNVQSRKYTYIRMLWAQVPALPGVREIDERGQDLGVLPMPEIRTSIFGRDYGFPINEVTPSFYPRASDCFWH
jgi:hypothetical protein